MRNWIWPVTPENWPTVKSKNIWAVRIKGKGKRVLKGDRIVFYVNGTLHFHGVYKVKNDWHEPTLQWPDEEHGGDNTVAEIDLAEIQLGFASVNNLAPNLNFIEKKSSRRKGLYLRGTPSGPANSGKPISEDDYTRILNELKQIQQEPDFKKTKEQTNEIEDLVELPDHSPDAVELPTPEKMKLKDIVQYVEQGRCAVPDFQRYWTWSKKQIEELWESIFQGYYVGSLLTWSSSEEKLGKTPIAGGPTLRENPDLILDGQQRITAIYYAVKSPPISLPNTETPYEFFLNINALLDPSSDSSEIIDSYSTKKVERNNLHNSKIQYEKKIFPLTRFQDKKNYTKWLFRFFMYLQDEEEYNVKDAERYHEKLDDIFGNVWSYEIPVVKLPENLRLDNVATVFERINSKGTPLGIFDLLNARFIIHDIALKKKWEYTKYSHKNMRRWYDDFKNNKVPLYIIQAMTLSKSGFLGKKHVLSLDEMYKDSGTFQYEEFLKDWDEMSAYVEQSIEMIISEKGGFGAVNYDFIPYTIMVPMIAALLKMIKGKPNEPLCHDKIKFWYWNNILSDRYSSSTDSTAESDFKVLKNWFDGNVTKPFEIEGRSSFNAQKNSSAFYKAIMCIIAKQGAHDFIRGIPSQFGALEDHHIFPHSKAKKFNSGDNIDSILNRTLILAETNKFLTNKDPSEYLKAIKTKQKINNDELQKRLSTHLISPSAFECMLRDDFAGFLREREKTIREEFAKLVGIKSDELSESAMISPRMPFSNEMAIIDTIENCEDYIYWIDKYFSRKGLVWLTQALENKKVNTVKIIAAPSNLEKTTSIRNSFKKFKTEMSEKGITCELRIIIDPKTYSSIHDRWIITKNTTYNIPSTDVIARGQFSQIKKNVTQPDFEGWWNVSTDIIGGWNEIIKNYE